MKLDDFDENAFLIHIEGEKPQPIRDEDISDYERDE